MAYYGYELRMLSLNSNPTQNNVSKDVSEVKNFLEKAKKFLISLLFLDKHKKIKSSKTFHQDNGDILIYYYNALGVMINYKRIIKHLDGSCYEVMFDNNDRVVYHVDEKITVSGEKNSAKVSWRKSFA